MAVGPGLLFAMPSISSPALSAFLTTNQCLEYIASRHQLPNLDLISYFWSFPPSQSSQQLEPVWFRCPELAEPSGFNILYTLSYNCPSSLSPSLGTELLEGYLIFVFQNLSLDTAQKSSGTDICTHQEGRPTLTTLTPHRGIMASPSVASDLHC